MNLTCASASTRKTACAVGAMLPSAVLAPRRDVSWKRAEEGGQRGGGGGERG